MCIRRGESLQIFQASAPALQLAPFRCRLLLLLLLASGVILRQARHVGSHTFGLFQVSHSRCTSILLRSKQLMIKCRRSLHDSGSVHWDQALSAMLSTDIFDTTHLCLAPA